MSNANPSARRVRVESNIYSRRNAAGHVVYEVGYRDSTGKQRWETVEGGVTAARTIRNDLLARKGKGEKVQPNPKLRFGEAATAWLNHQVVELRPSTRAVYTNAIVTHLLPRWERRRLDTITVEDVAALIRDLRADGKAEWTIHGVITASNRTFKYARRRMAWYGENPIAALEKGERPKVSAAARRPIFRGDELAQTILAAREPYKTLFALGSVTGARLSECLGLVWADVLISDMDASEVRFDYQVDRHGQRQPLKTEEARRTVEIPRSLAVMLVAHKLRSANTSASSFVFATRTGRAIQQRCVGEALRCAQAEAKDVKGRPTFSILHEVDEHGHPRPVPAGLVPSFHSFRHTAASEAIAAGESAEEISWQLGHKNSVITRAVYVQEVKSAERTARRRARMEERYGDMLGVAVTDSFEGPVGTRERAAVSPLR